MIWVTDCEKLELGQAIDHSILEYSNILPLSGIMFLEMTSNVFLQETHGLMGMASPIEMVFSLASVHSLIRRSILELN